jgi:hypothetical protein
MRILRNLSSINDSLPSEENRRLFNVHIWPFFIEEGWEYVDNIKDADVIPLLHNFNPINSEILKRLTTKQIVIVLAIFHIDERYDREHFLKMLKDYREVFPNTYVVHKNLAAGTGDGLIHYDIMFNRHKLYYHDYHKIENLVNSLPIGSREIIWTTGANKEMFNIPEGKDDPSICKAYLCPGLVYHGLFMPRMRYRAGLKDYLRRLYEKKGFINSAGNNFLPNNPSQSVINTIQNPEGSGGYWYPIGDEFYKRTYVSIYVETLCSSGWNTRGMTEKTLDPLIKGNFILPFAYSGFIEDVKSYGFKLPNFINYSYDSILDNDRRFFEFMFSIDMMFRDVQDFRKAYEENKHIIEHNRQVFKDRAYDTLYLKLAHERDKIPQPTIVPGL